MKKMTPEVREALQTSIRMSSVQSYGRDTVIMIMNHIAAIEWEYEAQLKLNKQLLGQPEVRVTLPQEVANVIASFRADGLDVDYIVAHLVIGTSTSRFEILRKYAGTIGNGYNLISALIHGYTVEQAAEDRIAMKISSMLFALDIESPIPVDELAMKLMNVVRESLAEQTTT